MQCIEDPTQARSYKAGVFFRKRASRIGVLPMRDPKTIKDTEFTLFINKTVICQTKFSKLLILIF